MALSVPDRPLRAPIGAEHVLFLKWLLLVVVLGFGFVGAWHYGLIGRVWTEDPTRITLGIIVLFAVTFGAGAVHVYRLSSALNHTADVEAWVERHGGVALRRALLVGGLHPPVPAGDVREHLGRVARKADQSGGRVVDQRLLLRVFDASLRRGQGVGWFVADLLLTLGLVGTVIGFIGMLAPLAGLDPTDAAGMKRAIGAMSGGMATALYTTLAGLVGGLLLRIQCLLLDEASDEVLRRTTELAELHLMPFPQAERAE